MVLGLLAGCQTLPPPSGGMTAAGRGEILLYDPANAIQGDWMHMQFRGATDYRLALAGERVAIQAVGRNSASGLIRPVEVDLERCPVMAWDWRVEMLQEERNLLADYSAAFGGPPRDSLWAVALFTDNDQTKEPVMAYYGPARMLCAGGSTAQGVD